MNKRRHRARAETAPDEKAPVQALFDPESLMDCAGLSNHLTRREAESLALAANPQHTKQTIAQLTNEQMCGLLTFEIIDKVAFAACAKSIHSSTDRASLVSYLHAITNISVQKLESLTKKELCSLVTLTRDPKKWRSNALKAFKKIPWGTVASSVTVVGTLLASFFVATETGVMAPVNKLLLRNKLKGYFGEKFVDAFLDFIHPVKPVTDPPAPAVAAKSAKRLKRLRINGHVFDKCKELNAKLF
eukprot:jgi/Mesvir1/11068/Mv12677-RA.1